jgi:putative transcriptional regulator
MQMPSPLYSPFAEMPSDSSQHEGPEDVSDEHMVRVRRLSDGTWVEQASDGSWGPMRDSETDWDRLANMTEEEIEANALSDPDNPPLTEEELARLRPLPNPKRIREQLGLSQFEFALALELSVETVQDWEDSFPWISYPVQTLLRLIEQDPEGVKAALEKSYQKSR